MWLHTFSKQHSTFGQNIDLTTGRKRELELGFDHCSEFGDYMGYK